VLVPSCSNNCALGSSEKNFEILETLYQATCSDADSEDSTNDRRSTRGFAFFWVLILYPVVSASNTMSRASTESEYKDVADATAEAIWIQTC
jgi:hypothetical protein